MNMFVVEGQVGSMEMIHDGLWAINLVENIYKKDDDGDWCKTDAIWYKCICFFRPLVQVGDKVIARGNFKPSNNKKYPYSLVVQSIGEIPKGEGVNSYGGEHSIMGH